MEYVPPMSDNERLIASCDARSLMCVKTMNKMLVNKIMFLF